MSGEQNVTQNEVNEDDWCVDCSDDEKYGTKPNGDWFIPREDVIQMFETLDKEKILKLQWECPGKRALSPSGDEIYKEGEEELLESKPEEKSDFDFNDEMPTVNPGPLPTRGAQPIGSAKKKTTSLDGILSNMRRHRQIAEMEKQTRTTANPSLIDQQQNQQHHHHHHHQQQQQQSPQQQQQQQQQQS